MNSDKIYLNAVAKPQLEYVFVCILLGSIFSWTVDKYDIEIFFHVWRIIELEISHHSLH